MIRGVIFDLDGVLVRTDELHYRSWRELADAEGIPFDRSVNERLKGLGRLEGLEALLENAPRRYSTREKSALARRKNDRFRGLLAALGPEDAAPGVLGLLAELRQRGVRLAVASSSRNATLILRRLGLLDRFDAVVDGCDISRGKPDPEAFLLAAERLGLPPEECVVVEDAAAGVEAARRAGMTAVGLGGASALPGAAAGFMDLTAITADDLVG